MSTMTQIPQETILAVLKRENFTCRRCGAKCPEHYIIVDKVFKDGESISPGDLTTYCASCHNEYFTDTPVVEAIDEPGRRKGQFLLLLDSLKEKGNFRKEQAREICEYFNGQLCGSKISPRNRIDIERALRVMEAIDVIEVLEDAYYNKVKIIDGVIAPRSYEEFSKAIPKYLYSSTLCDIVKQLRIIRGGCAIRLIGYDERECYRYLLEYKMALEHAHYTEQEIMKDLVQSVSQFDKATRTLTEWEAMMDKHRAQMLEGKNCGE